MGVAFRALVKDAKVKAPDIARRVKIDLAFYRDMKRRKADVDVAAE